VSRGIFFFPVLLFSIFFLPGCNAELSEPQVVVTKVVDAFYAQPPQKDGMSVEARYNIIASYMDVEEQKEGVMNYLKESEKSGMTGAYYIADNPAESQTATSNFQLVKLMKSSFSRSAESEFGEAEYVILGVTLQKVDGEWKILEMDQIEEPKEKISWIKVKPHN
jgi:hypothetical protein